MSNVLTEFESQSRKLDDILIEQCKKLYFRQSFITDILTCRQMALYRWVLGIEDQSSFLSAILGTAGHDVIYRIHKSRKFTYSNLDLMSMFKSAFDKELEETAVIPPVPAGFDSLQDAFDSKMPEDIQMLNQYQKDPHNHNFHTTMHEQPFVLSVRDSRYDADINESDINKQESSVESRPYLFTGTIDQAGVYVDTNTYALRDIKFRDNSFKPTRKQLDIDIQMTIYAAALAYGNPACEKCRPYYDECTITHKKELIYTGPCEECTAKIGTPLWPRNFPEQCELIWMRDYEILKRGSKGKKKGERKGKGYILTYRSPSRLKVLMQDVIKICKSIREGQFYREPGAACNFWCKFTDQCRKGVELEVNELSIADVDSKLSFATEDPF